MKQVHSTKQSYSQPSFSCTAFPVRELDLRSLWVSSHLGYSILLIVLLAVPSDAVAIPPDAPHPCSTVSWLTPLQSGVNPSATSLRKMNKMNDFWDMNQCLDLSPSLRLFLKVVLHLFLGGRKGFWSKAVLMQPQEGMWLELVMESIKKILLWHCLLFLKKLGETSLHAMDLCLNHLSC